MINTDMDVKGSHHVAMAISPATILTQDSHAFIEKKAHAPFTMCHHCKKRHITLRKRFYRCKICSLTLSEKCIASARGTSCVSVLVHSNNNKTTKYADSFNVLRDCIEEEGVINGNRVLLLISILAKSSYLGNEELWSIISATKISDRNENDYDVLNVMLSLLDPNIERDDENVSFEEILNKNYFAVRVLSDLLNEKKNVHWLVHHSLFEVLIKRILGTNENFSIDYYGRVNSIVLKCIKYQESIHDTFYENHVLEDLIDLQYKLYQDWKELFRVRAEQRVKNIEGDIREINNRIVELREARTLGGSILGFSYRRDVNMFLEMISSKKALPILLEFVMDGKVQIHKEIDPGQCIFDENIYRTENSKIDRGKYKDYDVAYKTLPDQFCGDRSIFLKEIGYLSYDIIVQPF
eukprot:TRINITY_DN7690_c0_g1_i1.p1 TRINITY_DN7690_c0_g1~~TRINITY_DN7690_c0_g1_i1.p1  ORF type:complete len:409 (-),score=71.71 TRINITY_DN7690_c0_g1_i1:17-1243(-)